MKSFFLPILLGAASLVAAAPQPRAAANVNRPDHRQATREAIIARAQARAKGDAKKRDGSTITYPYCDDSRSGVVFAVFTDIAAGINTGSNEYTKQDSAQGCAAICAYDGVCMVGEFRESTGYCTLYNEYAGLASSPGYTSVVAGMDCAEAIAANGGSGTYTCCNTYAPAP